MNGKAIEKEIKHHLKQTRTIQELLAINPSMSHKDAMELLGLSYNRHRGLMCNNGVYAYAIRQARDKQGIARIMNRVDRRDKRKLKESEKEFHKAIENHKAREISKIPSTIFVDMPAIEAENKTIINTLIALIGILLVALIYTITQTIQ